MQGKMHTCLCSRVKCRLIAGETAI